MKSKVYFKNLVNLFFAGLLATASCKENLNLKPQGGISDEDIVSSAEYMESLLIGAYASISEQNTATADNGNWFASPTNWQYGDITSDDAYKGGQDSDQVPLLLIEEFKHGSDNVGLDHRWRLLYEGINRTNKCLTLLTKTTALSEDRKRTMAAEARFLRGHFYFQLYRMFRYVPYIDENTQDPLQKNDQDILPKIIQDFQFAKDNLPDKQSDLGRSTKYAAAAYLGKTYLYKASYETSNYTANLRADGSDFNPTGIQLQDYVSAKNEFDFVKGGGFRLVEEFVDIYNPFKKVNNTEAIFSVKNSVKDGTPGGQHGDLGSLLNYINSGPGGQDNNGCCGFYVPSENLANAYKTRKGLPIDAFTGNLPNEFNDDSKTDRISDFLIPATEDFSPYQGGADPRLDFTIGRRGIPFLDYGIHPGSTWSVSTADQGNYSRKKRFPSKAESGLTDKPTWYLVTAVDFHIIRYADVLLMLAECETELNNLSTAMSLVNEVRARAKNSTYQKTIDGKADAAKYEIELYTSFPDKQYARNAVRFERRLEMAMEGSRFYDLVRWGIAKQVIDTNKKTEPVAHARSISFTPNKNEFFPIPQNQIDSSQKGNEPTLKQNVGY